MTEDNKRNPLLVGAALVACAALSALNWPHVFLDPLPLWYRVAGGTLLVAGVFASIMRNRALQVAGWIGILLFVLYELIGSIPFLNNPIFAANGEQPALWLMRLVFLLTLCVALVLCFKRLAPKSPEPPASSDAQIAPIRERSVRE